MTVNDTENGADWNITSSLKAGNVVYGDRTVKFSSVPSSLNGAEYIQTACDSKSYTGNAATFTVGADISIYVGLDARMTAIPG